MEKYNFHTNINSNISKEVLQFPVHLRGNHIADLCKEHAITILELSGINNLASPLELYVMTSKFRNMLRFAITAKRFDYESLCIHKDDDERGVEMYRALDIVVHSVANVYMTGDLPSGDHLTESIRGEFCKSLLWLVAMGLNTNQDLYNEYFGIKAKKI